MTSTEVLLWYENNDRSNWCYPDDKCHYPQAQIEYRGKFNNIIECVLGWSSGDLAQMLTPEDLNMPICFYDNFNNFSYESTFFLFAVRFGTFDTILWFLERGADLGSVEKCSRNGKQCASRSVLEIATAAMRRQAIIDLLQEWIYGAASIKSAK